jgi:hypothetical protein
MHPGRSFGADWWEQIDDGPSDHHACHRRTSDV